MAQNQKSYDNEFKAQAVKLAQEIGGHKAANELGIPKGTMYTWIKAFKEGRLSANEAVHTPKNALSLNDELIELRKLIPAVPRPRNPFRSPLLQDWKNSTFPPLRR